MFHVNLIFRTLCEKHHKIMKVIYERNINTDLVKINIKCTMHLTK